MKGAPIIGTILYMGLWVLCGTSLYADTGGRDSNTIAQAYFQLAQSCLKEEKKDRALEYAQQALEQDPHLIECRLMVANLLRDKGESHNALEQFRLIVAQQPDLVDARLSFGTLLRDADKLQDSAEQFEQIVMHDPNNLIALMEYGNILCMLERNQEALQCYAKVIQAKCTSKPGLHNFAFLLKKTGNVQDAITVFEKVIELYPDYALAHFNLATAYLTVGNFEHGWREYEWRWQSHNESPIKYNVPLWDGQDLKDKSILVYAEQGYGDTLQFVRYCSLLKDMGARVVFASQNNLIPLLRLCPYLDKVVSIKDKQAPACDYHISVMTLPLRFNTRVETIPLSDSYLQASPSLVNYWRDKLVQDTHFKIGICWHGNAQYPTQMLRKAVENKSIPLNILMQLSKIPGVSIYSLQKINGLDQCLSLENPAALHQFPDDFDKANGPFMDTAAVMKNLDLVITVDTSIAHLAGALGVPVWVILPESADWRWMLDRTDSPWYTSARLFKQTTNGNWHDVIADLEIELTKLVASYTPAPPPQSVPTNKIDIKKAVLAAIQKTCPVADTQEPPSPIEPVQDRVKKKVAQELKNYETKFGSVR